MAWWLMQIYLPNAHNSPKKHGPDTQLTIVGPGGKNIAPQNLVNYLRESGLRECFEIVKYNDRNAGYFWHYTRLDDDVDTIFLLFKDDKAAVYDHPPSTDYTLRSVGTWDGRLLCVAHAAVLNSDFNRHLFTSAMEPARQFNADC